MSINLDIVELLRKLKFIGSFPDGIDVLLVSVNSAVDEAKVIDKDLTPNVLKTILKKHNILVFSNLEDYCKYRGLKK